MTFESLDIGALLLEWGPVWALVLYLLWNSHQKDRQVREDRKEDQETIRELLGTVTKQSEFMREIRDALVRGNVRLS